MNQQKLKYFNDHLYGGIKVSELEERVIDTRVFQRLRRLRQLGLSSYVFPGAEHSRFTHSLGTLCVMDRMCNHLRELEVLDQEETRLLRLAALLHDIGHYPLSHVCEQTYTFMKGEDETDKSLYVSGATDDGRSLMTVIAEERIGQRGQEAHHEQLGSEVMRRNSELRRTLGEDTVVAIGNMITGRSAETTPFVHCQLLHSGLDCDRLDYLPRDSYLAGLNYGKVDVDYLIRLLRRAETLF